MKQLTVCLMGPTASGKTDIACQWVQAFPFEIISVDSAMIYQGMDIGTAKPSPEILQKAPHHLIDMCLPTASYSAAEFCRDVMSLSADIRKRGRIPLLVGGTMMYFRALQQGLSILPKADEAVRARLVQQHALYGAAYMHEWLERVDPLSSKRIHPHDTQRIQRALEVYLITQKPLSGYFSEQSLGDEDNIPTYVNLSLFPARRAWLHERIAHRFNDMLAKGFLDEVSDLLSHWHVTPDMPSMRSVGYRQALDYLDGIVDYNAFVEKGIAATRQLAKRQLTWLRSWPDIRHFDPEDSSTVAEMTAVMNGILGS